MNQINRKTWQKPKSLNKYFRQDLGCSAVIDLNAAHGCTYTWMIYSSTLHKTRNKRFLLGIEYLL